MTTHDRCVEAPEVADDRRQRGRDDRLVERGEQQDEQERTEDKPHSPLRLGHGLGCVRAIPVLELSRLRIPVEELAQAAVGIAVISPRCSSSIRALPSPPAETGW